MINAFHELEMPAKLALALLIRLFMPLMRILPMFGGRNAEDLLSHFWLDVYLWGEYPIAALNYLQEQDVAPTKRGRFSVTTFSQA